MVDDLKEYAEKYYTDEEYETLRQKYDFAQPFTKESLLYREIFEKYYPDRQGWCRTSGCPTRAGRAVMSMTPVPVCWQTTVTAGK